MSRLTVYSSNTCPNCVNLKKALAIKGIEFSEINISEKPEEAEVLREKGLRNLPVMNNNGDWMMGFTPTNFKKIIESHAVTA